MPSPIDMIFHGRKASNNGFPLFVNTKVLAALCSRGSRQIVNFNLNVKKISPGYRVRFSNCCPVYGFISRSLEAHIHPTPHMSCPLLRLCSMRNFDTDNGKFEVHKKR